MLYDADFGRSIVEKMKGTMACAELCDMWSGQMKEEQDEEAKHERRGVKATTDADKEESGSKRKDQDDKAAAAPKPSTVGADITRCFLPDAAADRGLDGAQSIDDLLAVYEGASFFNHPSLRAAQPEEMVTAATPGVPTGWRRADCAQPSSATGPSPMLRGLDSNGPHRTTLLGSNPSSPGSVKGKEKDAAVAEEKDVQTVRALPASYWHPDLRSLRYRTNWAAVLDFMEEQVELWDRKKGDGKEEVWLE